MGRAVKYMVLVLLLAALLSGCSSIGVSPETVAGSVTDLHSNIIVRSNGTSDVTVNVQLSLQAVPKKLAFPLPAEAKNISLNGGIARTSVSEGVRYVDLSGFAKYPGNMSFVIHYEVPDGVTAEKGGRLVLTLGLLSGFACPIEKMSFSVTLPDAPEKRPEFVSTYHQQSVDTLMTYKLEGNTIHCSFMEELKDHESLVMTLEVTEEQFPQPLMKRWSLSADDVAMYVCALAALVYWVLFLRCLPLRRQRRTQEPVGLTAGELGSWLTGRGVDFPLMVISWAQMGYLLIQLDDNGRVLLHKRMEMGNERKEFESRCFGTMFGRRRVVDGTGYHFARLCDKVAKTIPGARDIYLPRSGNPNLFRVLCAGIGLLGGVSLAVAMVMDTAWQVILGILFAVLGAFISWQIHEAAAALHLRKGVQFWIALGASVLWIFVGILSGEAGVALFVVGCQWLGGLAVGYGGRRTEAGRQEMADILGLRRYMRSVPKEELQRILRSNQEYYYRLAPYAMALGVDLAFARQMGGIKLPECTYLTTGMDGHLTAAQWNRLLREVVQKLDAGREQHMLKKLLKR